MFEKIDRVLNKSSRFEGRKRSTEGQSSSKLVPLQAAFICDQSKKLTERILKKTLSSEVVFRFKDRTLLIKAPHLQAYELELHRDQIENVLHQRFSKEVVSEVKIRTI